MVTFVRGEPVEGGVEPAGNLVMLMVVSSAAPFAQDATRIRGVYAGGAGMGADFAEAGLRNEIKSSLFDSPVLRLKCEVDRCPSL
jgi:hypothetical protein